jgi:hypothetical protein
MDDQALQADVRNVREKVGAAVGDPAAQSQAAVQNKLDRGSAIFQDLRASTGEAVERAAAVARGLSAAGTQTAAQAGELVKNTARAAIKPARRQRSFTNRERIREDI